MSGFQCPALNMIGMGNLVSNQYIAHLAFKSQLWCDHVSAWEFCRSLSLPVLMRGKVSGEKAVVSGGNSGLDNFMRPEFSPMKREIIKYVYYSIKKTCWDPVT
jgi:hypothetical protein